MKPIHGQMYFNIWMNKVTYDKLVELKLYKQDNAIYNVEHCFSSTTVLQ